MDFDELIDFWTVMIMNLDYQALPMHGFLTASVIAQSLPQWQSYLFEGHQKQVNPAVLAAISEWCDELQATLQDEREIELPFDLADIDYTDIENSEVS